MHYNTIFSQLFQFIPLHRFEKSVETHGPNRNCKHFTTYDKGYGDHARFREIDGKGDVFATRPRQNTRLRVAGQHLAPNEKQGVVANDMVEL